MSNLPSKIIVIGAGFAGLSATRELAYAQVEVTLIDQQNHHLFQPLLYQVATAALTPAEIAVPIRRILRKQRNAQVIMDRVVDIDSARQVVVTGSGTELPYDALVVATGAQHSYFGNEHWSEVAPGLKTLDDALKLRDTILKASEQAERVIDYDRELAQRLQAFVVVGAGPTGVEMAGAIAELSQSIVSDFRKIRDIPTRVILIEGGPRVLPSFDEVLSTKAQKYLEQLGVDVLLNTTVTDISPKSVSTNSGDIAAETTIWAAGVRASPAADWLDLPAGPNGRIEVDETLRPSGLENVYVIGDVARFEQDGMPVPGIAPVAKQMGIFAGKRLAEIASGHDPHHRFRYKDAGALATIGRNRAVADIYGLKLAGFVGWLLWGAAHVYFLIGFKNRLFVLLQWIWSYVTWQRGVRLIMDRGDPHDQS
ncbi:NAD(P)/FAD-dependent oxidoreductase [uncultured Roseobacter sp.]|uniref:NAD(P)/FAD-dependent oxidoreductase n=1 Tax=uncultured Roseobacter sp. TaxID=114847 RepID=UPI0026210276|nr:NAD(P)/FAD-dependent oxidoreductase [uncultured Roseobacter sp.]